MEYKEDMAAAKERMQAWFAQEYEGRPLMQIMAPRKGSHPASPWNMWFGIHHRNDPERIVEEFEKWAGATYFAGEAFPSMAVYFGAGSVAAYLGCKGEIAPDTVWFEPPSPWDYETILALQAREDGEWWRQSMAITRCAVERNQGNYFVQMADFGAPMNILGSMRGTQTLLMDLVDSPGLVRRSSSLLLDHVMHYYDTSQRIISRRQEGSITWMGIWFPGRGSDVQCDFCAMISPKMFEEFVLPDVQRQCRSLDHSIFHLDGPGQLPHLDMLLEVPELDGIQWVPGAGREGAGSLRWLPLYKKIQAKGKLLQILYPAVHEIEPLIRELDPRRLIFSLGAGSEEEARDLLKKAEQWAKP